MSTTVKHDNTTMQPLVQQLHRWANELGFQQLGITDTRLTEAEDHLNHWLQAGHHGSMHYMEKHGAKRSRPAELEPGTIRVITVRMDYLPDAQGMQQTLDDPSLAYVSRYALGRDYHKLMRNRLQKLANKIADEIGPFGYRAFVDSAPVLEKPLANKAGLGWVGKHTNLINERAGSWFFLGELYTDLPLPINSPADAHCGTCEACLDICPTKAIVAPYQLDARRCISYLTIESADAIPVEFRSMLGNRIYGCDDCQLVCPWNRFAETTEELDFAPRNDLDNASLVELFSWSEASFLEKTAGSAIRRIGHEKWLRNIAVALGNAETEESVIKALEARLDHPSALVREHTEWALAQHKS